MYRYETESLGQLLKSQVVGLLSSDVNGPVGLCAARHSIAKIRGLHLKFPGSLFFNWMYNPIVPLKYIEYGIDPHVY